MDFLVLTKTGGILGPFATVLGFMINYIYKFLELIGIPNIGLAIILFTLIVNLLMLPLTIKQQKSTKLMSVMNPELQKIQAKYKGKRDEISVRKMQAETSAVYAKYGTSPTGGCLYMIIQLPILFALYRVIYAVPAYVDSINAMYMQIVEPIQQYSGSSDIINKLIADMSIRVTSFDIGQSNTIIDFLYNIKTSAWNDVMTAFSGAPHVVEAIKTVEPQIVDVTSFLGGLNIADLPTANGWWPGALIPVLSGVTQYFSVKISSASQPQQNSGENPMGNSMKMMNTIMPLFSVFICFSFQVGIGIYWIASAVFRTITMVIANKMIDRKGIDEIIKHNREKAKKKAEKKGENPNKFEEYAKMSTKKYEEALAQQKKRKSISEIANTSTEDKQPVNNYKPKNYTPVDKSIDAKSEDDKTKGSKGRGKKDEAKNIAAYANMLNNSNIKKKK